MTDFSQAVQTRATLSFARDLGFMGSRYIGPREVEQATGIKTDPHFHKLPFSQLDLILAAAIPGSCLMFTPCNMSVRRTCDRLWDCARSGLPLIHSTLSEFDKALVSEIGTNWSIVIPVSNSVNMSMADQTRRVFQVLMGTFVSGQRDHFDMKRLERFEKEAAAFPHADVTPFKPTLQEVAWQLAMLDHVYNVQVSSVTATTSKAESGNFIAVGPFADHGIEIRDDYPLSGHPQLGTVAVLRYSFFSDRFHSDLDG